MNDQARAQAFQKAWLVKSSSLQLAGLYLLAFENDGEMINMTKFVMVHVRGAKVATKVVDSWKSVEVSDRVMDEAYGSLNRILERRSDMLSAYDQRMHRVKDMMEGDAETQEQRLKQ